MSCEHHQTAAEDKIPLRNKLGFALGAATQTTQLNGLNFMAQPVLNLVFHVSPFLIGLLQSIPRIWDAFSDPIIGHLSDNTRSRWGRRKPYLLAGAVSSGILFFLLWCIPRDWGQTAVFCYFLVMALLYFTATTVFIVPWCAIGNELTDDYHERTRVMGLRVWVGKLSGFLPPWLYAISQFDFFEDKVTGVRTVALISGLLIIVTGVATAMLTKERLVVQVEHQKKEPIYKNLKEALKNRAFMILNFLVLFVMMGVFLVISLDPYVIIFYMCGGDQQAGSVYWAWHGTAGQVAGILSVPVITWLATKIGKQKTLGVFLPLGIIGSLLKWVCFNSEFRYLVVIPNFFITMSLGAMFVMALSMLADICDQGELQTGRRQEGVFGSIMGWITKLGMSLAFVLSGIILTLTGFDEALPRQTEQTLFLMRILDAVVPVVFFIIGLILLWFYPITEEKAYDFRTRLQEKRAGL